MDTVPSESQVNKQESFMDDKNALQGQAIITDDSSGVARIANTVPLS